MKECLYIVEGENDISKLKSVGLKYVVKTNGYCVSRETIKLIESVIIRRPVIVFADPDGPGRALAQKIEEEVPSVIVVEGIRAKDAKKANRVGVAYMNKETVLEALKDYLATEEEIETVTEEDMFSLGLVGYDSKLKKLKLVKHYHLPSTTLKAMKDMFNCLRVTPQEIKEILSDE